MLMKPNIDLKMHLFKNGISQRELSLGTGINEGLISLAVKHGQSNSEMREKICQFLQVGREELFPWDD